MKTMAILVGQFVACISKIFNFGAGGTWPGEIALRFNRNVLSSLTPEIRKGIIVVAGTNGKTTTTLMIKQILTQQGWSNVHNDSGANLENGVVSTLLSQKEVDYGIFEVDENALPEVMKQLSGYTQKIVLVLLNLFRDQLDRYGEVTTIAEKWTSVVSKLGNNTKVIINADDPLLSFIGTKILGNVFYYGFSDSLYYLPYIQHATDSMYCPKCNTKLHFTGVYFSHLGDYTCPSCDFSHPKNSLTSKDVVSPLEGVYNIYNTLAATSVGLAVGIPEKTIQSMLSSFTPAFGRMEEIVVDEKKVKILLSKNPTGFNESLRTALSSKQKGPMMLVLNDKIPDGTDISWIWDVDFEVLQKFSYPIVISGDRALDMGLRIKYSINGQKAISSKQRIKYDKNWNIEINLRKAIQQGLVKTRENETLWILATYSAMLEVRKILTGKKIL